MLAKKPKGATEKKQGSGLASLLWMFVGAVLTLMTGLFLYLWNPFDIGSETSQQERAIQPIQQPQNENGGYEFYDLLPEQDMVGIPEETILDSDTPSAVILEPDVVVEAEELPNRSENSGGADEMLNPMGDQIPTAPSVLQSDQEPLIEFTEEAGTYDDSEIQDSDIQKQNNDSEQQISSSASIQAANTAKTYILQINSFGSADEADKRRAQVLMAGVDARVVKTQMANNQTFYQVVTPPTANRQKVITTQQKLQNNGIDSLIVEQRR